MLLSRSIAEGSIKVTRTDGEATDGTEIRAAINKFGTSAPVGASFRWALNASAHFLQLQVSCTEQYIKTIKSDLNAGSGSGTGTGIIRRD